MGRGPAVLHSARLHWSSLVFAGLRSVERDISKNEFLPVFWLVLATSADLEIQQTLAASAGLSPNADSCLVFAVGLDCWHPENKERNHPKKLLLNRSTLFPQCLVGKLEGRLKHLRTLSKGAGEMAHQLPSLTAFPEVPSSTASNHMAVHSHLQWDQMPSSGVSKNRYHVLIYIK